jgi:hypothetical protein
LLAVFARKSSSENGSSGMSMEIVEGAATTNGSPRDPVTIENGAPGRLCRVAVGTTEG